MAQQALNGLARAAVGIGAGVSLFQASVYNVDGGFRAVMFDRLSGVQRAVRGEGTHFRIPWVQTPHQFDVRIRPRNISSATGTKDLQIVTINLRVLSRPEEEHLPDIFSNLGVDYDERVLPSIGNEVLKAVVAQYNAEQLITKREAVSREVRDELTKRATEFHILLEDVSITDLKFGKEFTAAVEAKQVAQQASARERRPPLDARARAAAAAAAHPPLRPAPPGRTRSARASWCSRRSRRSRRRSSAPRASRSRRASSRPPCRSRPPSSSSAASKRRRTSQTRSRARAT